MSQTEDYSFGTGSLKELFDEDIQLAIISMAAQVKYCLENKVASSSEPEAMLKIWTDITSYIESKKNKVRRTKKLRRMIKAKKQNKLAEFLEENW